MPIEEAGMAGDVESERCQAQGGLPRVALPEKRQADEAFFAMTKKFLDSTAWHGFVAIRNVVAASAGNHIRGMPAVCNSALDPRTTASLVCQGMQVAHEAFEPLFHHMGVDLRGGNVSVTEKRLYDA